MVCCLFGKIEFDVRLVGPNVSVHVVYIVLMELTRLVFPSPLSTFYLPFLIYFKCEDLAKRILRPHPALLAFP